MSEVQKLIDRIERGGIEPLCRELLKTDSQHEVLRDYFGGGRFDRLRNLALKRQYATPSDDSSSTDSRTTNNVLVVPGFSGSRLAMSRDGVERTLWFDLAALSAGGLDRLKLAETPRATAPSLRAAGLLKRSYGELLLTLASRWNVRSFAYDWRQDLEGIADKLARRAAEWFGRGEPFHIVAFGMGGLVARLMIARHTDVWTEREQATQHKTPTRLIMIGSPNHGSLIALQMLTGLDTTVSKLAQLDERHSRASVARIFASFPSVYQMLPSLASEDDNAWLYETDRYLAETASQQLDRAAEIHYLLAEAVDPRRMISVAGSGQPTPVAAYRTRDLASVDGYKYSLRGDGCVSHEANALELDGEAVPTYFVDAPHGQLTSHPMILAALDELLVDGRTDILPTHPPSASTTRPRSTQNSLRKGIADEREEQLAQLADALTAVRNANDEARGSRTAAGTAKRFDPARVILNDYLDDRGDRQDVRSVTTHFEPAEIQIRLVQASIEDIGDAHSGDAPLIDAISVGHYLGVEPQTAELALDRAISAALDGGEAQLLLTELAARGTLSGQLAQPFILPDPRQPDSRVLAIAGMGLPGRLGIPELVVLARELCWSLGRMGKRHLATVLIGAGGNTLDPATAIDAWLRGMKLALTGTRPGDVGVLECITFVCRGTDKLDILRARIAKEAETENERQRWHIRFDPEEQTKDKALRGKTASASLARERGGTRYASRAAAPTRITATLDTETYRFGAITQRASVPERDIPLDPKLVHQVNDSLVSAALTEQYRNGLFLQKLLLPEDFREHVQSDAPLILMLDHATARIHWELMVGSSLDAPRAGSLGPSSDVSDFQDMFWGTGRGLTRQLRTSFAPPPEPPPPARRLLRVLIVADPAEDQPLLGAQQEGFEVAELFESYNRIHADSPNRVEVVRLLGPREATRINVMRHLMLRTYDVLHFAGHCSFNQENPARSGWLFSNGELMTAHELSRIDRVPKFVFSNACESGVTTMRPELRNSHYAPSFAEAVFFRGVSNFICTAWPVNDAAARRFARTLYAHLLNVVPHSDHAQPAARLTMHQAMREARLSIATTPSGETTWGAYQHYGNPNHRFFSTPAT